MSLYIFPMADEKFFRQFSPSPEHYEKMALGISLLSFDMHDKLKTYKTA